MFKLAGVLSGDTNAINDLLNACRDEHQGLLFIKDAALPECSFIAIEAIWWSIEHCEDIETEQAGLNLFQVESTTHQTESLPRLVSSRCSHAVSFGTARTPKISSDSDSSSTTL